MIQIIKTIFFGITTLIRIYGKITNWNNDINKQTKEKTSVTDTVQTQKPLSQDLMQDVKSLLLYMDQLLEDLPEEKIEEFANSDKFVLFKNVFEKLGLN